MYIYANTHAHDRQIGNYEGFTSKLLKSIGIATRTAPRTTTSANALAWHRAEHVKELLTRSLPEKAAGLLLKTCLNCQAAFRCFQFCLACNAVRRCTVCAQFQYQPFYKDMQNISMRQFDQVSKLQSITPAEPEPEIRAPISCELQRSNMFILSLLFILVT